MPGKLILVRHGQSTWNLENLFTGWHDVDLSEQGRKEAAEAARQLLVDPAAARSARSLMMRRSPRLMEESRACDCR